MVGWGGSMYEWFFDAGHGAPRPASIFLSEVVVVLVLDVLRGVYGKMGLGWVGGR